MASEIGVLDIVPDEKDLEFTPEFIDFWQKEPKGTSKAVLK